MATDSANVSVTNTLTTTTADTVTLKPGWMANAHTLTVVNWDASTPMFFTFSYTGEAPATAVTDANNTIPVMPSSSTAIRLPKSVNTCVVSIVGNGNKYTCAVLPGPER
jgi:hypothetical protein